MAVLCPWCGAEVADTKFCENCGSSLTGDERYPVVGEQQVFDPFAAIVDADGHADAAQECLGDQASGQSQAAVTMPPFDPFGTASAMSDATGIQAALEQGANQPAAYGQLAGQQVDQLSPIGQQAVSQPYANQQVAHQQGVYQPSAGRQGAYQPPAGQQDAHRQQPFYQQADTWPQTQQAFPQNYQPPTSYEEPPASEKRPWYGRTWVIVAFLLFFWPVGLVLMWMRTCAWSKVAKVIVTAVLALMLVIDVATSAYVVNDALDELDDADWQAQLASDLENEPDGDRGGSSDAGALGAHGSIGDDGASRSASAASGSSASGSSPSAGPADSRLFDASGAPTLYALCELSGLELVDLLDDSDYVWMEGINMWLSLSGGLVEVYGADGPLPKDKVAELGKLGVGAPVAFTVSVQGYDTPKAALKALAKDVVIRDQLDDDSDDITFAIVHGSGPDECLVAATQAIDEGQTFLVFNEEAVESGLFAQLVGVDAGQTFDEIWDTVKND